MTWRTILASQSDDKFRQKLSVLNDINIPLLIALATNTHETPLVNWALALSSLVFWHRKAMTGQTDQRPITKLDVRAEERPGLVRK